MAALTHVGAALLFSGHTGLPGLDAVQFSVFSVFSILAFFSVFQGFQFFFVGAVQFSLLFSGRTGLPGLGGYASPPLVSYGQFVLSVFSVYNIF